MDWTDIFAAWGTTDAAEWVADVENLTTEGVYYADPHTGPVEGRTGLIAVIEQFRTLMPDGGAVARDADGYDGHGRAAVDFLKGGKPMMTGQYFAALDGDGRITHLIGFSSPPTP